MAEARHQPRPTFFWQAVLILLPVIVLAAIGWVSLRQDKLRAQHEAEDRSQAIVDDLLPKLWAEVTELPEPTDRPLFRVNLRGELIFPKPYEQVPIPSPLDTSDLDTQQERLWRVVQRTSVEAGAADATAAYQEFILSNPPQRFAVIARYQLGLLLLNQQDFAAASDMFMLVATNYPVASGESGLPLQPLAQLKLMQLAALTSDHVTATNRLSAESFYSNAVFHPTPLTLFLLNYQPEKTDDDVTEFQRSKARSLWEIHEFCRYLFEMSVPHLRAPNASVISSGSADRNIKVTSASPSFSASAVPQGNFPRFVWIRSSESSTAEAGNWLGVRFDETPTNRLFVFRPKSDLEGRLSTLVNHLPWMPDYFAVGIEVAGLPLARSASALRLWQRRLVAHGKGGGQSWEKDYSTELATNILASAAKTEDGAQVLKLSVYLTSPTALFESQRRRAIWFYMLITASTVAALFGLLAAWAAFHRQQRLAEMKSNFVSSVSHELRAPIASVRLMAESLERGKISGAEKQGEYFRFIGQECRRLSSLIENVLDFSRIEQGQKQYEFEPTDLAALVQETVKLMEPNAAEKGVRLQLGTSNIQHPTSNIELSVDGRAIQQALVNLIDNAIKHSPKGETVTIGLEVSGAKCQVSGDGSSPNLTPDTSHLTLFVSDHGAGIPLSEHEKIFERFYRLGSELRRETQGVGIGLSIVKHIVEAHGGCVLVESAVGKGSRFTIELPMKRN